MLEKRAILYLFSFVLIQFIVLLIAFEFLRKPWEGVEVELERVLELEQNKILENTISCFDLSQRDDQEIGLPNVG